MWWVPSYEIWERGLEFQNPGIWNQRKDNTASACAPGTFLRCGVSTVRDRGWYHPQAADGQLPVLGWDSGAGQVPGPTLANSPGFSAECSGGGFEGFCTFHPDECMFLILWNFECQLRNFQETWSFKRKMCNTWAFYFKVRSEEKRVKLEKEPKWQGLEKCH